MSIGICCGFECGVTTSGTNTSHAALGSNCSFNTNLDFVRSGLRSLRVNPTASTGSFAFDAGFGATHVGRVYIYIASNPNAHVPIIWYGTTTSGPNVSYNNSDGKIYARVGTTAGASGITPAAGWNRIDYRFIMSAAGDDTSEVKVNGQDCGTATAAGLAAASSVETFGIGATATGDIYFDDLAHSGTGADYPYGGGYVHHFICIADGTHNIAGTGDFQRTLTGTDILNATTTAFQLVDDVPLESGASVDWINMLAPPNATDYVECIIGPAPGIPTPIVPPRFVDAIAAFHMAGTGTGNMQIRLMDNGSASNVVSRTTAAGSTTVIYSRFPFASGPSGSAWNLTGGNGNFNNLRVRFGSPGAVDVNPDQYFDSFMLEAEFRDDLDRSMYARPYGAGGLKQMHQILAT